MYYVIFFSISLALSISTFGISLIVFFVIKNWFDKQAAKAILSLSIKSLRTGEPAFLHHVNKAAIVKVFDSFSLSPCEQKLLEDGTSTSYTAPVAHPGHKGSMILNVIYTPRSGTKNTIIITAQPI
ncbi:MAG: hypothetical protein HRU05_03815 [Oceanospirillaceae bacterium]|nr:hypothetical protein [Oceanospirillaceae bacterium]